MVSVFIGILSCLDGFMNIALEQTEEYDAAGQLRARYGDAFIRGNNVLYISTPGAAHGAASSLRSAIRKWFANDVIAFSFHFYLTSSRLLTLCKIVCFYSLWICQNYIGFQYFYLFPIIIFKGYCHCICLNTSEIIDMKVFVALYSHGITT